MAGYIIDLSEVTSQAGVSLDGRIVTLQWTPERLQFIARDSPNMFVQSTWHGKHAVPISGRARPLAIVSCSPPPA
ncbi:hypothetical protein COCOBI_16-4430 [Coccomyxa sp. Obi]|nr:hypothetical protein COCOBI_16-4430 [Coccomyxa sp. Obi]